MNSKYPEHIALILDGNRRWAKEKGLPAFEGHRAGRNTFENLFDWMIDLDIKELTLYCFSIQNFKRSSLEVNFLMELFTKNFNDIAKDPKIHSNNVKINVVGETNLLPLKLRNAITNAQKATENYKKHTVNFCIAYGGQEEIVSALKNIAERVKDNKLKISDINIETVKNNLYLSSYPDVIIRTSGEVRTSNFLVWQQAYSEWFFINKFWPDFTKKDLENVINEYQDRERRFGK
jgi:tritrans,polycis-undecaprenyl-diphosphate synthase [geranylgeranyl-diphosphate specific]